MLASCTYTTQCNVWTKVHECTPGRSCPSSHTLHSSLVLLPTLVCASTFLTPSTLTCDGVVYAWHLAGEAEPCTAHAFDRQAVPFQLLLRAASAAAELQMGLLRQQHQQSQHMDKQCTAIVPATADNVLEQHFKFMLGSGTGGKTHQHLTCLIT